MSISFIMGKLRDAWDNTTVEPVVVMYCLIVALSSIPGEELYLKKACTVNLNHSMETCNNIYQHDETQIQTQKLVSGIQSYSAILQGIPGIVFALIAGPISDTYGRKPLIIIPLFGYFILNLVYLVNSIWFHQLKVEYLLFECLQDLTGGTIVFFIATKCFIVDITSEEARTTRLAMLDAFYGVGYLIGFPIGTLIKKQFGYVPLFSLTLGLSIFAMIYVLVFIKDSYHLISGEHRIVFNKERAENRLKCDSGVLGRIFALTISSFKSILKKRSNNDRLRIILLVLVFSISSIARAGYRLLGFMFFRLQYKISTEMYGHLVSYWYVLNFFSQMVLLPFLVNTMNLRDTTIIILSLSLSIVGYTVEAFLSEEWTIFLVWFVFFLLYNNMFTTARSAMSKLLGPTEIGKAFSVLGVLESCLSFLAKPIYGFIYQSTLHIFPGLWFLVSNGVLLTALVFTLILHVAMKNREISQI